MIVKEDFLKKLRYTFDLNVYECKIWTALLSRGISTAAELTDISNVPRSRSYDVLESLEKKGFVIMKLGKPIKYIVVNPEEIILRLKKNIAKQTEEKITNLDKIKEGEIFKYLNLLHDKGINFVQPADLSGAVRGRDNIYNHIETLLKNAKKSVTIVTSSKGFIRKVEAFYPILLKLKKQRVEIRIAAPLNQETREILIKANKVAEVRNIDKINARFVIIDNKEIVFMVMNDEEVHSTYDVGIWVNTPYFANALENMFNTTWQNLKQRALI